MKVKCKDRERPLTALSILDGNTPYHILDGDEMLFKPVWLHATIGHAEGVGVARVGVPTANFYATLCGGFCTTGVFGLTPHPATPNRGDAFLHHNCGGGAHVAWLCAAYIQVGPTIFCGSLRCASNQTDAIVMASHSCVAWQPLASNQT
jgi:hypothetical protein